MIHFIFFLYLLNIIKSGFLNQNPIFDYSHSKNEPLNILAGSLSSLKAIIPFDYRKLQICSPQKYEKAERFPDMVKSINKFVEMDPKLTKEERNLLSAGYKNIISDKRSSWRLLNNMERKEEEKKNTTQSAYIKEIKDKIETELNQICAQIQSVIDKYLIPNATDVENKVFYLKLKADYYRYKCEFANGKEFDEACDNAEKVYKEAYELSNKEMPITNSTRLGLDLNFSVFYYEIKGLKEEACTIAKNAFDESMKSLDDLEKSKAKDTLLIIQLLKENLILWTNEMNGEEE